MAESKNVPTDKKKYAAIKGQVKATQTWPSAYASATLVRLYKAKGGKFRKQKAGDK